MRGARSRFEVGPQELCCNAHAPPVGVCLGLTPQGSSGSRPEPPLLDGKAQATYSLSPNATNDTA